MSGEADEALGLIRQHGVGGLADFCGCYCGRFAVKGVTVEIACRKSTDAMEALFPEHYGLKARVFSHSMDWRAPEISAVAAEVVQQLTDDGYAVAMRCCEEDYDRDNKCVCCGKQRENNIDYLCKKCNANKTPFGEQIAEVYDFQFGDKVIPGRSDD